MPKIEFTQEEVNEYLKDRDESKHHFYKETVEIAQSMSVHANGHFPEKLIGERRPNEPAEVLEYRKKIFKPKTKPVFTRVMSSLAKIRRSQDWGIKYVNHNDFPRIKVEDSLEWYFEKDFPFFTSVTNWAFTVLLRKSIIDPNAVIFVRPIEYEVQPNEYLRPFPYFFDSVLVHQFVENDYAVLENPEGATYYVRSKPQKGRSFYFVTTKEIIRYDQVDNKNNYAIALQWAHGLEMLPVFKVKGLLIDQGENSFLYESRLSGMIPELDEAIREYSDLQASIVTSAYSERWEYAQNECLACKGSRQRRNELYTFPGCGQPEFVECGDCGGKGYVVSGPYSKMLIRPLNNAIEGGGTPPIPPAGYIEKDVEIIKLQTESVDKHIYSALASVNMQFLDQSPLNVSGLKTEVDKDELNNTVHSIAEDTVSNIDNYAYIAARYRYGLLYSFDEIEEMLPMINVPEKYDLIGSSKIIEEIKAAKDARLSPVLINEMERDVAKKKFYSMPEVEDRLQLVLDLDPLPNVSEDDKMSRLSNKGITQETYIISSNIQEFVTRAIDENEKFVDLPLKEQKAIMMTYAKEIVQPPVQVVIPEMEPVEDDAE